MKKDKHKDKAPKKKKKPLLTPKREEEKRGKLKKWMIERKFHLCR